MANRESQETGGANLEIDDETGMPYWELWGEGWKDTDRMDVGEEMKMLPTSFPPGTRIVVIEPQGGLTREFYESILGKHPPFYPLEGERLDKAMES